MKLGTADITAIKLGSVDITKVMLGTEQVWVAGGGPVGSNITLVDSILGDQDFSYTIAANALPGHEIGDLLLLLLHRNGTNTISATPSGWTSIASNGGGSCSFRLVYKIAESNAESVTVDNQFVGWLAATYRGVNASDPIGTVATDAAIADLVDFPPLTFGVNDGSSWATATFISRGGDPEPYATPPTGLTERERATYTNNRLRALWDTNGGVTGYAGESGLDWVHAATEGWHSCVTELRSAAVGGPYEYEVFTADGVWNWAAAGSPSEAQALIVSGGGGGGTWGTFGNGGGGGGAGGIRVTPVLGLTGDVSVVVGDGGAGGTTERGTSGAASSFGSLTAVGGGGGGGGGNPGYAGGSGGGAVGGGAANTGGDGTKLQGYAGGNTAVYAVRPGAGGGGKSEVGADNADGIAGDGGDGITLASIGWEDAIAAGAPSAIGGGGGGGINGGTTGAGGLGGGGAGNNAGDGFPGTANTGGGGGGRGGNAGSAHSGGAGGSGLVIVRWVRP